MNDGARVSFYFRASKMRRLNLMRRPVRPRFESSDTRTRERLSNSIANVTQEIYSGEVYLTG